MYSTIASVLLGVAGWLVVSFFGKPLLDFWNLRSQVQEEIIFTGNVSPIGEDKAAEEKARDSLRHLAAKVLAMNTNIAASPNIAESPLLLLRWLLSRAGFDLARAGRNLIGLSNSMAADSDTRALHINSIQVGLKLPRDYDDEYLCFVKDQIRRPGT